MQGNNGHIELLNRFNAVVASVLNVDYNSLRGFDTPAKKRATWLAKKILKLDDGIIATYYRINVNFMRNGWEDVAVEDLVDDCKSIQFTMVTMMWLTLTDSDLKLN